MKPLAKKKARAMSQGMGSPKPENAAAKGRGLVRTETPNPNIATAPRGKGCVIMPTIVPRKIASSCHALRFTPAGTGENQRITPVAMEAISGFMAAPCHGCTGAGAGVMEAAEALTVKAEGLRVEIRCGFLSEKFGKEEIEAWRFGLSEMEAWRFGLSVAVVLRRRRREGRAVVVSATEAMVGGSGI